MPTKLELFIKTQLKTNLPDIRPGDTVRIHQKIKEAPKKGKSSKGQEVKERIQMFEGLVIARKHGKGMTATITVRKMISGIGVEKIFPLHSPIIEKIEIVKRGKARRAKLYYLREAKGKRARLKKKEFAEAVVEETPTAVETETTEKPEEKTKNLKNKSKCRYGKISIRF